MENYKSRLEQLKSGLYIDEKRQKISELKDRLNDEKVWSDWEEGQKISQDLSDLQKDVEEFEMLELLLENDEIEELENMIKQGLTTRPFFYPLSSMPGYAKFKTGNKKKNPVSYDISERGIILPAAFNLEEKDIKRYCKAIRNSLREK